MLKLKNAENQRKFEIIIPNYYLSMQKYKPLSKIHKSQSHSQNLKSKIHNNNHIAYSPKNVSPRIKIMKLKITSKSPR